MLGPPGAQPHPQPNLQTQKLSTTGAQVKRYGVVVVVVVVVVAVVVVVVVAGDEPPPPPLLLFDNARTPNAITTPAPTSQINGGSLSAWACFTPAADPGASGPISADIAGNGAIAKAALTTVEISALFTLSSPFLGILFQLFTIRNIKGQLDNPPLALTRIPDS